MFIAESMSGGYQYDGPGVFAHIAEEIKRHFPDTDARVRQTIAMAEEVGEFVAEARRYLGMARRTGDIVAVRYELADVIITAYVTAVVFDIPIERMIEEKLQSIQTRGYRDPR